MWALKPFADGNTEAPEACTSYQEPAIEKRRGLVTLCSPQENQAWQPGPTMPDTQGSKPPSRWTVPGLLSAQICSQGPRKKSSWSQRCPWGPESPPGGLLQVWWSLPRLCEAEHPKLSSDNGHRIRGMWPARSSHQSTLPSTRKLP